MRPYLTISIWITLLTIIFTNCSVQTDGISDDFLLNINKRIKYGLCGAIAIGIIDQNGIRYYNFGSRDSTGTKVNEHSIFEIGSISKTFTATLLADQVSVGNLNTDDLVNELLPKNVQVQVLGNQQISLGHLADHTSGLPRMPLNFNPTDPKNPFADYTVLQLYEFISTSTPTREVGVEFEYSNLAVGLLGHVLSIHTEKTYEELLIENIAIPLGMKETKTTLNEQMRNNLAVGRDEFGRPTNNWDFIALAGAGAIKSSTSDMIKYLSIQLGFTQSPLKHAIELTHLKRHEKYPVNEGDKPTSVGLGWIIDQKFDSDTYWHNGGTGGYRTYLSFNKALQKGVVVLATGDDPSDIGKYLMNSDSLKEVKRSLSTELARKIDMEDAASANTFFKDSVINNLDDFIYGSFPLNRLAYEYLEEDIDASITVFQINTTLFPYAADTYVGYGAALRIKGRLEESLDKYREALKLNPDNQKAQQAIIEIEKELGLNHTSTY